MWAITLVILHLYRAAFDDATIAARIRISELKKEIVPGFEQADPVLERLERALATEHETTRRHMEVLIEQIRADFRLARERWDAHDRRMDALRASMARDRAALLQWLQDHNVRLSVLETLISPPGSDSH